MTGEVSLLRVALPVPLHREFDYLASGAGSAAVGRCVRVKLGPRRLVGVVVDVPAASGVPADTLIAIEGWADDLPTVPPDVLELARFAASYYQHPLGMTLQHAVPPRGRKGVPLSVAPPAAYRLTEAGRAGVAALSPRARRQRALADALATDAVPRAVLLDGVKANAALLRRWETLGWIEPAPAAVDFAQDSALVLPPLNAEQKAASQAIMEALGRFQPFLLQGVTGSGKTEVYLSAAAAAIAAGRQVLLLVPEINLTPQLAARVARALPRARIVQLHSHLGGGERLAAWRSAAAGDAQLVLGTRLSIFAPLPRLGLVIVDEEHDTSYKQQDGLRYNARDLAVYRARLAGVPVLLGSATPSLETLWQAEAGRYGALHLRQRAVGGALPPVRLARQRDPAALDGLSTELCAAIAARLARGEQTLLFVNRRGYAPSLLCAECGWMAQCERCSARLVVHLEERRLRCHHCGHEEPIVAACPECGNQDLLPMGFGTQRLESVLRAQFPAARIARIDADSTRRKGAWSGLLDDILAQRLDILVGTQMMVKGHDFPHLTLVGVLGADNALYSADFRATERLFAQLMQVSGRAGRAELPGEVIVQTDFPTHPLYLSLQRHDYDAHASALLAERQQLDLPPWSRLALLRAEAGERALIDRFLAAAHEAAATLAASMTDVRVNPPVPARLARRAGFERSQLLVQGSASKPLQAFLTPWREWLSANGPRNVRWSLDVDPQEID